MASIVTFYSYKGGTGRSMALANVAIILASAGRRVLVVDWDLEAPGLHHYFRPFLPDPDLRAMDVRGVIDLVFEYASVAATPLVPDSTGTPATRPTDWYKPFADITQCAIPLRWPWGEPLRFGEKGGIDFVPAGRQEPQVYADRVNGFDWRHFYEKQSGGAFVDAVRERMQSYDYVLIDSRTGVSDTAGICTVQLPDALVLCFTLNNQSIKGAAGVAASLRARNREKPIWPVPMRVDPFEKDKLNRRREYAHQVFEGCVRVLPARHRGAADQYWQDVEIPYFASYAYEEMLAPFERFAGSVGSLLPSLEKLTGHITAGAVARLGGRLPDERRDQVAKAFEETESLPVDAARERPPQGPWQGILATARLVTRAVRSRASVLGKAIATLMVTAVMLAMAYQLRLQNERLRQQLEARQRAENELKLAQEARSQSELQAQLIKQLRDRELQLSKESEQQGAKANELKQQINDLQQQVKDQTLAANNAMQQLKTSVTTSEAAELPKALKQIESLLGELGRVRDERDALQGQLNATKTPQKDAAYWRDRFEGADAELKRLRTSSAAGQIPPPAILAVPQHSALRIRARPFDGRALLLIGDLERVRSAHATLYVVIPAPGKDNVAEFNEDKGRAEHLIASRAGGTACPGYKSDDQGLVWCFVVNKDATIANTQPLGVFRFESSTFSLVATGWSNNARGGTDVMSLVISPALASAAAR